jgi:hypothetical protein
LRFNSPPKGIENDIPRSLKFDRSDEGDLARIILLQPADNDLTVFQKFELLGAKSRPFGQDLSHFFTEGILRLRDAHGDNCRLEDQDEDDKNEAKCSGRSKFGHSAFYSKNNLSYFFAFVFAFVAGTFLVNGKS